MSPDLPEHEIRALIRPHTGELAGMQRTARGFSSDLTAMADCEKGPFFVKAVRNRPGGRRDSITREKLINPYVSPPSPALRWHAEDEHWIVLGFEAVDGRSSDLTPGSSDLPSVVELVDRIGRLDRPEVARDWPETRWNRFALDQSEAELFQGDALLHCLGVPALGSLGRLRLRGLQLVGAARRLGRRVPQGWQSYAHAGRDR